MMLGRFLAQPGPGGGLGKAPAGAPLDSHRFSARLTIPFREIFGSGRVNLPRRLVGSAAFGRSLFRVGSRRHIPLRFFGVGGAPAPRTGQQPRAACGTGGLPHRIRKRNPLVASLELL